MLCLCPDGVETPFLMHLNKEGATFDNSFIDRHREEHPFLTVDEVVVAFMKLLQDGESSGIMVVTKSDGPVYK